jgi:hypothetical protein
MTTTTLTESHIDGYIRLMRIGGIASALFAAFGIAHGIHDVNPDAGWLTAGITGSVAAIGLAIFWHAAISMVYRMVRTAWICATFALCLVVTAFGVGASAQAIATMVAGQPSLVAELSTQVDAHNRALAEAYKQATGWRGVAEAATVLATGYDARAEMEAGGKHGTGKGQGQKWSSYKEFADGYRSSAAALNALLDDATEIQAIGNTQMTRLRTAAAHGDQEAFLNASGDIASTITRLDAIDPKPIVANMGVVSASAKGIDLTPETQDFKAKADKAFAGRQSVDGPVVMPISLGEATRRQMGATAMHAWILASVVDIIPLGLLLLGFIGSREVWLHAQVVRRKLTPEDRNEADRNKVVNLTGRTPFINPTAAE